MPEVNSVMGIIQTLEKQFHGMQLVAQSIFDSEIEKNVLECTQWKIVSVRINYIFYKVEVDMECNGIAIISARQNWINKI